MNPEALVHPRVLIVDDEPAIRESIRDFLTGEGIPSESVGSGEEALSFLESYEVSLVITDLRMEGIDGIELLRRGRETAPDTLFAVLTAFGDMETAIAALRGGAVDFLMKPVVFEDLLNRVRRCLVMRDALQENVRLKDLLHRAEPGGGIVGGSDAMAEVSRLVQRFGPTGLPVLVTGASGTGKELVARSLHVHSDRATAVFLPVNCAALPEGLFESELFGHRRGAFTGADRDKEGLVQLADKGTLFLDEIAEIPPGLQAKLLRALESGEVLPLGGSRPVKTQTRIIAASNRDLALLVREGLFRADLYFRINVLHIHLPTLAERRSDIPALVSHLIEKHRRELRSPARRASREAIDLLRSHEWKGNVRELENVLQRALILADHDTITPIELPTLVSDPAPADLPLRRAVRIFERTTILRLIDLCGGDKAEAARRLEISLASLYSKIREED